MQENVNFEISVPSDEEGFILLKCSHCGDLFKVTTTILESDHQLFLYCPCCGLISNGYLTDDVVDLANCIVENYVEKRIDDLFSGIRSNEYVQISMQSKASYREEYPIRTRADALEKTFFDCCNLTAKVKPLLKMTGCYCPFCGVKNYETK